MRSLLVRCARILPLVFLAACASQQKRAPESPSEGEAAPVHAPPAASPESSSGGGDAPKPAEPTAAPPPATAGGSPSPTPAPKTPTTPGAAGKTMVGPNDLVQAQVTFDDAAKAFSAAGTDCLHLCKALGSMQNATNHLCELVAGTADQKRCSDAKAKLESAQAKVKSSCGSSCG